MVQLLRARPNRLDVSLAFGVFSCLAAVIEPAATMVCSQPPWSTRYVVYRSSATRKDLSKDETRPATKPLTHFRLYCMTPPTGWSTSFIPRTLFRHQRRPPLLLITVTRPNFVFSLLMLSRPLFSPIFVLLSTAARLSSRATSFSLFCAFALIRAVTNLQSYKTNRMAELTIHRGGYLPFYKFSLCRRSIRSPFRSNSWNFYATHR